MSVTLTQFAYQALRDLGCLRPGQTTSVDMNQDILTAANQMLDSWQLDELMAFTRNLASYTLTGGTQTYTIGPSEVSPNITAARPTRIEEANIILNTIANPVVRKPLKILTDAEWLNIRVQQIPNALPLKLYYDIGFDPTRGFGTIRLWPGPISAYLLELLTWQQLQSFPDLVTGLNFPPGYAKLIRKGLAVQIAPLARMFAKVPGMGQLRGYDPNMLALVRQEFIEAKAAVQSYNAPPDVFRPDDMWSGSGQRGAWNYVVGEPNN